jgi:hypothetical protein
VHDVNPSRADAQNQSSPMSESLPLVGTLSGAPRRSHQFEQNPMTRSLSLEERLKIWITAKCLEQNPKPSRFAELNRIFRDIYRDKRFWRYRTQDNRDYYEEALFRMWRYFLRNLCEATTAKTRGSFLQTRDYAVGRLLTSLEKGLINIQNENKRQRSREEKHINFSEDAEIDLEAYLPQPEPAKVTQQWDAFLLLLETDGTGELKAEINTLRGKTTSTLQPYMLTAQTYLLMRHRDEMTIQQIADELDIPRGSLQGGTKPTRWKNLERKFAQMALDAI